MLSKPRILFLLKFRPKPNYNEQTWGDKESKLPLHSGLFNSATYVCNMLKDLGYETDIRHVEDGNKIHKEVVDFKADICVLEAFWTPPYKLDDLYAAVPNVKFIVRNHSETPFLASEGMAFNWILQYIDKPNCSVSCNSPRMLEETRTLIKAYKPHWTKVQIESKTPYLPNFYPLEDKAPIATFVDSPYLSVGCFGAVRPLKNHVMQAIASIKFAERNQKYLKFHINSTRVEMNGNPVLNNLRGIFSNLEHHKLIEEPWQDRPDFLKLVRTMDIVSQVSFTETFNIVAADAVLQGVPIVTSKEIPWSSHVSHASPTDVNDISNTMHRNYQLRKLLPYYDPNFEKLQRYNRRTQKIWDGCFR